MTRKEQIIEIAQWIINNRFPKSENNKVSDSEMYHYIIDAILSLPIDIPSDDWIEHNCPYSLQQSNVTIYSEGAKDMRDEILKRNGKD